MKFNLALTIAAFIFLSALPAKASKSLGDDDKEITLTVMPNPIRGNRLVVKMEGLTTQSYILRVVDNAGNLIVVEKFSSPTSTNFKMLELRHSVNGTGRVQLIDEHGKVVTQTKFIGSD